jgi:hypothetical protein
MSSDEGILPMEDEDFRKHAFDDYYEMMKFCRETYGVAENDFKSEWETNYPGF